MFRRFFKVGQISASDSLQCKARSDCSFKFEEQPARSICCEIGYLLVFSLATGYMVEIKQQQQSVDALPTRYFRDPITNGSFSVIWK